MTADVMDAVIALIEAEDSWPAGAPDRVHFGEIPPMTASCEIGVMPERQDPRGLVTDESEETFVLQLSLAINPKSPETALRRGLATRQHLRALLTAADSLGLSEVTMVDLLDSTVGVGIDTRSGMNAWVLAADIRFSVTYRDDF